MWPVWGAGMRCVLRRVEVVVEVEDGRGWMRWWGGSLKGVRGVVRGRWWGMVRVCRGGRMVGGDSWEFGLIGVFYRVCGRHEAFCYN